MPDRKVCMNCGVTIIKPINYSLKQWETKKYCSRKCGATSKLHKNPFIKGHKHSPQTLIKLSQQKLGDKNPQWKGGRFNDGNGYFKVQTGVRQYQLEHRYVMEKLLNRKLDKTEHVHHINGDRGDNRLENLIVMKKKDHIEYHRIKRIKHLFCTLVDCKRPHRSSGLCAYHYNKRLLERRKSSVITENN